MDFPEFRRLAERELNEAAQYYDAEEPGLGSAFLQEVDRCVHSIHAHPEAAPILRGDVRRRLLRRFLTLFSTRSSRLAFESSR
jgi:hypothetical protein